ncbi:P-loop containing nucleoside triphosphate hydrolase protein [Calycina marina]|uniref:P-loop containing nucleoside triphosphate hydrolase protein n=1 Tax=Calycina marina TaxID=1763456 RepID=A0A9P8CC98_9HELO|nr:P-loop containing nucleoside triphosphate hydrolase protein [Calycina marina]
MTDLTAVLPDFPTQSFSRDLSTLEKYNVTVADLLTQKDEELSRRCQLQVGSVDVRRLQAAILHTLQNDLGLKNTVSGVGAQNTKPLLRKSGKELFNSWSTISTLDDDLDRALGGGIPTGYITEITGESGAGKTQFLLTLLLAAQLPSPKGLSSNVLYISTESALPVTRLSQLLRSHQVLQSVDPKPSLDAVMSIVTPDLESQDHIIRFQVPVAIRQQNVRLIILDSVAANYRAEFDRPGAGAGQTSGANMAQRSSELIKLGQLLRDIAREHDIAIVVANQVADRFSNEGRNSPVLNRDTQSSPLARRCGGGGMPSSSMAAPMSSLSDLPMATQTQGPSTQHPSGTVDAMSLAHQQRWFTGWGDDLYPSHLTLKSQKTPSLGLIWTTQIACRIALVKKPVYDQGRMADQENERGEPVLRTWRRWMKFVFAPHARASGPGLGGAVGFEIQGEGVRAVVRSADAGKEVGDDDGLF